MSYSISTLLTRNLHDVFGENDPARRRAAIADIPDVAELCRALCLVLLIGALDRVADVLPVLIAEVRELPEGSTSTAEEGASIDDDGFARQVIAAVGHQEGREIPQLLHPPHAAHRVVDRRGIVRLVHRGGADRAGVQALPCALRREETGGDGVAADAVRCPLDGE